jgi:hypothetical protein
MSTIWGSESSGRLAIHPQSISLYHLDVGWADRWDTRGPYRPSRNLSGPPQSGKSGTAFEVSRTQQSVVSTLGMWVSG